MNAATQTMRYLLGEMQADEQTAFEQAYFADPRVFAEVADAETALIDTYVRGTLQEALRQRFEQVYLTDPRRRERVEFAKALVARADHASVVTSQRRWFAPLALAAGLLVAVAAGVMWYEWPSSRPQPDATQVGAPEAGAPVAPTAPEPRTTPSAPPAPDVPVLALVLAPGVRSSETVTPATLSIPDGTAEIRLALTIREPDAQRLRVIVRAVGGAEIARRDLTLRAGATGTALTLTLPARDFSPGDYLVTLQGVTRGGEFEDLSQTLFQVVTR